MHTTIQDVSPQCASSSRLAGLLTLSLVASPACSQPSPPGSEVGDEGLSGASLGDGGTTGGDGGTTGEDEGLTTGDGDADGDAEAGETETGGNADPGPYAGQLYPLADGATWIYLKKTTGGQILGEEIVDATEIEWDGDPAWMLSDNPNAEGEWTESVIVREDEMTMRVHKEIQTQLETLWIVDYDPGFTRANDAWWEAEGFSEELFYDRTETDGNGDNEDTEPRGHIYTVEAVHEMVEVPAGTFDCVQVKRVRSVGGNAGEIVYFWYAQGVGKVREERPADSSVEELASVHIPEGVDLP